MTDLRMLTPDEAAERMGRVSRMTVLRRIHSGELDAVDIAPSQGRDGRKPRPRWRITEAALEDYVKRNQHVLPRRAA